MNSSHEGVRQAMFMAPMVMARMAVVSVGCLGGLLPMPATAAGMRSTSVMASPQDGPVTVEATGRGESPKEARKEAIVAALRQIVGEYVEADVVIANDEVVKNEILSFSNAGGVKSEQVGQPRFVEGDLVEVTMRVTVEPKPLVARVKGAAKAGARLDGAALAAEIAAAKDDYEAKKRVLDKAFANLPDAVFQLHLVDSDGQPTRTIDPKMVTRDPASGRSNVVVVASIGFDQAAWREQLWPALDRVLTAAARSKIESAQTMTASESVETGIDGGVLSVGHQPSSSPQVQPGTELVMMMRESIGRGRQLVFDAYVLDKGLFPYLQYGGNSPTNSSDNRLGAQRSTPWLRFPARTLRVRLRSADGEAIEGVDRSLSGDWVGQTNVFMPRSLGIGGNDIPQFIAWNSQMAEGRIDGLARLQVSPMLLAPLDSGASRGSGSYYLAPLWMSSQSGMGGEMQIGYPTACSTQFLIPFVFSLDPNQLARIDRVEVEVIAPSGTN